MNLIIFLSVIISIFSSIIFIFHQLGFFNYSDSKDVIQVDENNGDELSILVNNIIDDSKYYYWGKNLVNNYLFDYKLTNNAYNIEPLYILPINVEQYSQYPYYIVFPNDEIQEISNDLQELTTFLQQINSENQVIFKYITKSKKISFTNLDRNISNHVVNMLTELNSVTQTAHSTLNKLQTMISSHQTSASSNFFAINQHVFRRNNSPLYSTPYTRILNIQQLGNKLSNNRSIEKNKYFSMKTYPTNWDFLGNIEIVDDSEDPINEFDKHARILKIPRDKTPKYSTRVRTAQNILLSDRSRRSNIIQRLHQRESYMLTKKANKSVKTRLFRSKSISTTHRYRMLKRIQSNINMSIRQFVLKKK